MFFEWSLINEGYIIYKKNPKTIIIIIIIITVFFFILVHGKSPKSVAVFGNPARIIGKLLVV